MFPVEERIPEIASALRANREVVLVAPPGSGKTTGVPPALIGEPWLAGRKVVMLEPRRLAARNCAAYIARRRGEEVGGTIGYQVRLERRVSAATRLEVVTEGLLAQRILADPELGDVGLVVFDEFHERSLACDLAFALALEVRRAFRPDLRILVMSATLDVDEVMRGLRPAGADGGLGPALVQAQGRAFPVETRHLGDVPMSAAVARALAETDGDVLCFLPGEGEIRRVGESLNGGICGSGKEVDVLPLYGSLPKEDQDLVFAPSPRRKVVLATSIAETSLTIDGVTAVVDSGLMRVPRFSPGTGMTGLVTLPLTRDRAEQRRGRAGRVRPGICYRLWTESDEVSRPQKAMPEILDADLCRLVLTSAAWGAVRRCDLPWMTPPPAAAWDRASSLLKELGALDGRGVLTEKGRAMSALPMHPRLANMILAARRSGAEAVARACRLAAVVEEGPRSRETDIRYVPAAGRVKQLAKRFEACARMDGGGDGAVAPSDGALLAEAFPDRVARNRGNATFQMVSGRGAFLPEDDPLAREPFIVCCELDDRPGDARAFRVCPIARAEVEALFGDRIEERPFCAWDRANERVKCVSRRVLGAMTLDERSLAGNVGDAAMEEAVVRALLDGVRQKGVENLPCWTDEARQTRARMAFLSRTLGADAWPEPTDARIVAALAPHLSGMRRWRDLERVSLGRAFDSLMAEAGHDRRELERFAPARMEVPSGSRIVIRYDGDEPTAEVRLQECFGLMETPRVAGGRVPVVMCLLSPARRPIQVTKDLSGFWRGAYQLVRKDMRGRYPRHYWPEDPFSAVATRRSVKSAAGR